MISLSQQKRIEYQKAHVQKLTVWGTWQWFNKQHKQCRVVVATRTKKAAAKAFDMSMYMFNEYACDTGNDREIKLALENPGTVIEMERI